MTAETHKSGWRGCVPTGTLRRRLLLAAAGVLCVWLARFPVLQTAGGLLVVDNGRLKADVAVMLQESGLAGELELAAIFHEGAVHRVALLVGRPSSAEVEFQRRGVYLADSQSRLAALGVPASAIVLIDAREGGTTEATKVLAQWAAKDKSLKRLIVVTSRTHSRRALRQLKRSVEDRELTLYVRPAQADTFDPSRWWRDRRMLREGIVELQKLLLDWLLHPFE